ncbi:glycosyltransferase family 4 protein [Aggregatibacter actinomycetemcomitans]|uniref:glycosyltransferase family 4 protein n=1 Tax=Aggregatibacter actinomycetemcomitans TaxID=714 RepID=UPI0021514551|nr:glycosyltransferase family 4 protein [Aggregatibacter actinomycetemcomitans]
MKVAIIHYWLVNLRGGEKVLEALCELYPQADIFTHVYIQEKFQNSVISKHKITTTFISKLPWAAKHYQLYLPFMPLALEEMDLSGYDLVISSESGPAKGVIVPPGVPHICYCHSPMRYAWDMYGEYRAKMGKIKRFLAALFLHYIRRWDQLTSQQVTKFIANSQFVAKRIKSYYAQECMVIYPPVQVDAFELAQDSEDYYLILGQLVPYKKTDLAVRAFNQSGKKLVVIGDGVQLELLKKIAQRNVKILGYQPFQVVKEYLMKCKALIFPGVEDFGIVPLEAMACGKPVIAFAQGGALETIKEGITGSFFYKQTENSLNWAVSHFEQNFYVEPYIIRQHAMLFSKENFKEKIHSYINQIITGK